MPASALLAVPSELGAALPESLLIHLRCDVPHGRWLSAWQIFKKALWDEVRGSGIEATATLPLLAHLAFSLEQASLESPEVALVSNFVAPCPIGLLAARLFLLCEILKASADWPGVVVWEGLESSLHRIVDIPWLAIVRSEWPIFALLVRLGSEGVMARAAEALPPTHRMILQAMDVEAAKLERQTLAGPEGIRNTNVEVLRLHVVGIGSGWRLRDLLAARALWGALAAQTENEIQNRALRVDHVRPVYSAARYFLRNMRAEFAGSAGALVPFLSGVLALARHGLTTALLSCWDVGAAPVATFASEVWALCLSVGGFVRAFEPSVTGFARLVQEVVAFRGTMVGDIADGSRWSAERLALSNTTGVARLNRGGKNTGSLGTKACGLWLTTMECADPTHWEDVNISTVDELLGAAGALDILKLDVEGHEWEVVMGASRALSEGRIGLVVLEYGDKWSSASALAAKHFSIGKHRCGQALADASGFSEPCLRSVSTWFAGRGYEAYFIGSRTPIPIGGEMWHDVYEVCQAPHRVHYHGSGTICWFDVAFVHIGHPLARALRDSVAWDAILAQR